MNGILNIGKNGLQALQNRVEIITNNIVNSNTPGYKKLDQSFQELIRNEVGKLGTPLSDKLDDHIPTIGSGVKSSKSFRIFEQGSLVNTDDSTQLAIDGNGFFAVKNADKDLLLTRSLKFNVDSKGNLVDQNGYKIQLDDDDDFDDINAADLSIDENGEIYFTDSKGKKKSMGEFILYDAENRDLLVDAGGGYFKIPKKVDTRKSTSRRELDHFGKIRQSSIEMSNVDLGEELVGLIVAQRAYQFSSKSIQAADEMWQITNNIR